MAVITKQELIDAARDALDLEKVVNGSAAESPVTTRLGATLKTLAKILDDLYGTDIGGAAASALDVRIDILELLATYLNTVFPRRAGYEQSGWLWALDNLSDFIKLGLDKDEVLQVLVASQFTGKLSADLLAPLAFDYRGASVNILASSSYQQSGYIYAKVAGDMGLLFGISDDPAPKLRGSVLDVSSAVSLLSQVFGGQQLNYLESSPYQQAGRHWSLTTADGNEVAGLSSDPFPEPRGALNPFNNARPEYIDGTTFSLFTERDGSNLMQVKSVEKATGVVRQLSTYGNNINPRIDSSGTRAIWSTNQADPYPSKGLRSRTLNASALERLAFPRRALTVLGDSVDTGVAASTGAQAYANLTGTSLSVAVTMRARGGQQIWQQGMWAGVVPIWPRLTSGTTIATTATAIDRLGSSSSNGKIITTAISQYPSYMFMSSASTAAETCQGEVVDSGGVRRRASMRRTFTAGTPNIETYTVQSERGAAITVSASTFLFIPDTGLDLQNWASIGGGLNDLAQGINRDASDGGPVAAATILADVRTIQDALVAALPVHAVYSVLGQYNQAVSAQATGTAPDLAIIAHNDIQRTKYQGRFVDRQAIFAAGGDGSANDLSDIANHWPPRSLRAAADTIHPNTAGHALVHAGNSGGPGLLASLSPQTSY